MLIQENPTTAKKMINLASASAPNISAVLTTAGTATDASDDAPFFENVAYLTEGVFLLVIAIAGLLGNTAAIVIFARQRVQRNFHSLMMSLAAFDMLYIISSLLIFALPQLASVYKSSGAYYRVLPVFLPLAQIGLTGGVYFTMAITLERYFTVCHPFFHVVHAMSAKKYILPIITFAVIYNLPKWFELRVVKDPPEIDITNEMINKIGLNITLLRESLAPDSNETALLDNITALIENGRLDNATQAPSPSTTPSEAVQFGFKPTALRKNPYYIKLYCGWLNFLVNGFIPFVVLITLNSLTLHRLTVYSTEAAPIPSGSMRRQGGGHGSIDGGTAQWSAVRRREVTLAKISLAIVFVFIVCHSIKWIPNIYEIAMVDHSKPVEWPNWVETMTNISHLLMTLNSSVNFYIYLVKHPQLVRSIFKAAHDGSSQTVFVAVQDDLNQQKGQTELTLNPIKAGAPAAGTAQRNGKCSSPNCGSPVDLVLATVPEEGEETETLLQ